MRMALQPLLNLESQALCAATHVGVAIGDPDPDAARDWDHRRLKSSRTRCRDSVSTSRSTRTRQPPSKRFRCRRRCDLAGNKSRHDIPAQPAIARQTAPCEQLARRQPGAPRRHRYQSWPTRTLGDEPLLFFQCPPASSARRDHFFRQAFDIGVSSVIRPASSSFVIPRKGGLARAIGIIGKSRESIRFQVPYRPAGPCW